MADAAGMADGDTAGGDTADGTLVTINVGEDGPLEVIGSLQVVGADGTVLSEEQRIWLCRCGHSAKKPFCDGSHRKAGFTDPGTGADTSTDQH